MHITILTYLEKEGSKDYDPVVPQVAEALRQGGHRPSIFGIHGDLKKLINGVSRRKPDLIFNLMETFGETQLGAVGVAGVLELLGLRYTGGGPGEYYLQEDKGLTKKLMAFDGISYPDFAVFSQNADLETGGKLRMPLFVKPLRMDASIGIDAGSLVYSARDMMQRVLDIHQTVNDSALVEEYIEGREFYVGILGNQHPRVFPPVEMDFSGLPDGKPHILDARAKWEKGSVEYRGTTAVLPELPDEMRAKLQRVALDAYRALRVRDYGRIDMRLTETGQIYVIEVNASCYLDKHSEFASAAQAAGLDYPTLINQIAETALRRYELPNQETRRPSPRKRRRRARAV